MLSSALLMIHTQAFPSGSGPSDRTTYMFTYVSPMPGSPTLEELLEEYWILMPQYQVLHTVLYFFYSFISVAIGHNKFSLFFKGVSLDSLKVLRVIYGIFPTYRAR